MVSHLHLCTTQGTTGNAAQYVTRNQALKKLQLPLSQFRYVVTPLQLMVHAPRIHPPPLLLSPSQAAMHPQGHPPTGTQEETTWAAQNVLPRQRHQLFAARTNHKSAAVRLHNMLRPLLYPWHHNSQLHNNCKQLHREQHAYQKKLRRARARKNEELLHRLQSRSPTYRLDHLVRERYPAFVDALRDLSDPLTLVHLFAVLPADHKHNIPPKLVLRARELALEWQAYVVRTHALRKVFVSVKGYYYQADVQGQAITWLVPHATGQVLPADVDYRVMLTFLEFYEVLLAFVNYKLYHAAGCRYPPPADAHLEKAAAGMLC